MLQDTWNSEFITPWAMPRTVDLRARCGLGLGAGSDPELCAGIDGTPKLSLNHLARVMLIGQSRCRPRFGERAGSRLPGTGRVVVVEFCMLLKSTGRRQRTLTGYF